MSFHFLFLFFIIPNFLWKKIKYLIHINIQMLSMAEHSARNIFTNFVLFIYTKTNAKLNLMAMGFVKFSNQTLGQKYCCHSTEQEKRSCNVLCPLVMWVIFPEERVPTAWIKLTQLWSVITYMCTHWLYPHFSCPNWVFQDN